MMYQSIAIIPGGPDVIVTQTTSLSSERADAGMHTGGVPRSSFFVKSCRLAWEPLYLMMCDPRNERCVPASVAFAGLSNIKRVSPTGWGEKA